jgi:hypothetical protein
MSLRSAMKKISSPSWMTVSPSGSDTLADEQTIAVRLDADEANAAVREIEYLGRTGVENELLDERADKLLRADAHIDRNGVLGKQLVSIHILG